MEPMRTLIHRLQAFTLTALELAGPDRRSNCEADVAGRPPGACCPWSLIGVTWLSAAVQTGNATKQRFKTHDRDTEDFFRTKTPGGDESIRGTLSPLG